MEAIGIGAAIHFETPTNAIGVRAALEAIGIGTSVVGTKIGAPGEAIRFCETLKAIRIMDASPWRQ